MITWGQKVRELYGKKHHIRPNFADHINSHCELPVLTVAGISGRPGSLRKVIVNSHVTSWLQDLRT